jgi:hypothetical protein
MNLISFRTDVWTRRLGSPKWKRQGDPFYFTAPNVEKVRELFTKNVVKAAFPANCEIYLLTTPLSQGGAATPPHHQPSTINHQLPQPPQ